MIDDLITRGVTEPYRMFTSRAEYRLALRADNADQRLTAKGVALGCVGPVRAASFEKKSRALEAARVEAKSIAVTPNEADRFGIVLNRDGQRRTAFDLLSYPNISTDQVARVWPGLKALAPAIAEQLEIDAKYSVYLDRQREDAERFRRDETVRLPEAMDFDVIPGLSNELRAEAADGAAAHAGACQSHRRHDAGRARSCLRSMRAARLDDRPENSCRRSRSGASNHTRFT